MDRELSVARGATALYGASVLVLTLNTGYFVVLTNFLTTSEVGLVSLLNLVVISIATASVLALPLAGSGASATPPAVSRFLAQRMNGQASPRAVYVLSLFVCSTVSFLLSFSLSLSHGSAFGPFYAASFDAIAFSLGQLGSYSLVGVSKAVLSAKLVILSSIVRYALASFFLVSGHGVTGIFLGFAAGDTVLAFSSNAIAAREVLPSRASTQGLRPVVSYMLSVFASALVGLAVSQSDKLVAFVQRGLADLGVYNVAVVGAAVASFAPVSVMNVLVPALSADATERVELLLSYTRYVALVASPMGLGLAALSPFLLRLFGDQYVSGAPVLALIAVSIAATSVSSVYSSLLLADGAPHLYFVGSLAGLAGLLLVSILLSQTLGIVGVAIGRASMLFISFGFFAYFARRRGMFVLDRGAFSKSFICSFLMAVSVSAALNLIGPFQSRLLAVGASLVMIPVGLTVYLLLMKLLHGLRASDIELFQKMLPPRLRFLARFARSLL